MVLDDTGNFIRTDVTSAIGSGDTTINVADASEFDGVTPPFNATVWDTDQGSAWEDSNVEIVRVTAFDTGADTITVTRAQEGTSDVDHPDTSAVLQGLTAQTISDIDDSLGDTGGFPSAFESAKGYGWNAETSTILDSSQDDEIWSAIQHLKDTSAGDRTIDGGQIWLPPGSEWTESTPWSSIDYMHIEGFGGNEKPRIKFADTSSLGISANDVWKTSIDGVILDGTDAATRDGAGEASAWSLNNTNSRQFNVGKNYGVEFENWGDPHIHHGTGHPFNSHWGHIYQSDIGDGLGRLCHFEDGGEPLLIDVINIANHISASSTDEEKGSGLHWKNSGGGFIIGMIECGAAHWQRQMIFDQGDQNTNIHVRYVVMETSANNPLRVGNLDSSATVKIDDTRVQGNDIDEYYRLGFNNQNKWIGFRKIGNGTITNSEIMIEVEPIGVSYVLGSSSDIGNPNGYSTGNVRSLETAGGGNA